MALLMPLGISPLMRDLKPRGEETMTDNKRIFLSFIAALSMLLSVVVSPSPAQQAGVAKITRVQLPVELVQNEPKTDKPLQRGMLLLPGDIIKTGTDGRCMFCFAGGSELLLNQHSTLLIKRGELLLLTGGQLWAHIRGERMVILDTPGGEVHTGDSDCEFILAVSREEQKTKVSVLSGNVEIKSTTGTLQLSSHQKAVVTAGTPPQKVEEPEKAENPETNSWLNYGNKTAILLVRETALGENQDSGSLRQELERIVAGNHYSIVKDDTPQDAQKHEADRESQDSIRLRNSLRKQGVDLVLTGRIITQVLGEVGSGLVSCGSRGEIKAYVVSSGELVFSRISNSTSIGKTPQKTGREAASKVTKELATSLNALLWEINENLADSITTPAFLHRMELIFSNCTAGDKKILLEKLKKRGDIRTLIQGVPGKDRIVMLVETTASPQTLADFLKKSEKPGLQLQEAGKEKLKFKVLKKDHVQKPGTPKEHQ
jgi:hypothetical protein